MDTPAQPKPNTWLLALCYVWSFILGAGIDIIRHSYDRIAPAIAADQIDGAILRRAIIASALIVLIVLSLMYGPRWSLQKFGPKHRLGLIALFVLTPVIVYVLEH